jgi:beta-xylosidase
MDISAIHNFHVYDMNTSVHRTYTSTADLTSSEVLNDCNQVVVIRDQSGQLLEVDFTPNTNAPYLTGNTVSVSRDQGVLFNILV